MSQKQRINISKEQRLFLLRELVSIREGLSADLALPEISVEARIAVAGELALVSDVVRKLERHSPFTPGVNY